MKCPSCDVENKEDAKRCKKCNFDLTIPSVWKPGWKWHVKTLIVIYVMLGIIYVVLRKFVA